MVTRESLPFSLDCERSATSLASVKRFREKATRASQPGTVIEAHSIATRLLSFGCRGFRKGAVLCTRAGFALFQLAGRLHLFRILIVDDNPAVRRYLRAILEQQETWQVCGEARNGGEALRKVLDSPPDLIVLDYQMPDLNGVDVAKQISATFPKMPILMVTLHLSRQLADAARQAGVRGACAKQDIGAVVEAVDLLLHDGTYFPATPGAI